MPSRAQGVGRVGAALVEAACRDGLRTIWTVGRVAVPGRPAALISVDDNIALPLGSFDAAAGPGERYLVRPDGSPCADALTLSRAVWRMLAAHVYRDVRLVEDIPDGFGRLGEDYGIDARP